MHRVTVAVSYNPATYTRLRSPSAPPFPATGPPWPLGDEVPVSMPVRIAEQRRDNHHADQQGDGTQHGEGDDAQRPPEHRRQAVQGSATTGEDGLVRAVLATQ